MIIIGITGTLGAGKGTIVDYLVEKKNFSHFSVRQYLLRIIRQKGMPENRDSMVSLANDLRQQHGPAFIVEQLFIEAQASNKNTIIESIRNVGEIEGLRKLGTFYLLAVDADTELRYNRIIARQSETDHISFDEFIANEKREMQSTDMFTQNIFACMQQADFLLTNNGTYEELFNRIEEICNHLTI